MTRLALLLAAVSVLGTGCFVETSQPTGGVDVAWSFVRTKIVGGTPVQVAPYSCATQDFNGNYLVYDVVVSFDGDAGQAVPCSDPAGDGALLNGLVPGTHTMVVTARQSIGGQLVGTFNAQTTVTVSSGRVTQVSLPLEGIPGNLDVWGGLYSASGATLYDCDPTVPSGTFSIEDSAGTVVATGTATCAAAPVGVAWRLGVGFSGSLALDLDVYRIRMTAASGQYDSASRSVNNCSGQAFYHVTTNDTGTAAWYPRLYDVSAVPSANLCP